MNIVRHHSDQKEQKHLLATTQAVVPIVESPIVENQIGNPRFISKGANNIVRRTYLSIPILNQFELVELLDARACPNLSVFGDSLFPVLGDSLFPVLGNSLHRWGKKRLYSQI